MTPRSNPAAEWLLFGGGNFQLAFTVWLLDQLPGPASANSCVLVRPTDSGPYPKLEQSSGRFRCVLRGMVDGERHQSTRELDKIDEVVYPWEDFPAYLNTARRQPLRYLVSNTTEAGLRVTEEPYHPDRPAETFPGKLTQWLYHRFQHFDGSQEVGVTLLPLELLAENGPLLKSQILHYASSWKLGDAFANWIVKHCPAHSTLVDRIVSGECSPVKTNDHLRTICAEPYFLWAIESPSAIFAAPENLVSFTPSLSPIRNAKVRLLNATHTAMVAMGLPREFRTVKEMMASPDWGPWVRTLIYEELYPSLAEGERPDEAYVLKLLDRLANPFVEHQLWDISLNSLAKVRTRLWPAILDYQQKFGRLPARLLRALQSIIAHYQNPSADLRDAPQAIAAIREHQLETPKAIRRLLADARVWGESLPVLPGMFPV